LDCKLCAGMFKFNFPAACSFGAKFRLQDYGYRDFCLRAGKPPAEVIRSLAEEDL